MDSKKQVTIMADKVKIYGPKEDGGYNITIQTGEYSKQEIAELMRILMKEVVTKVNFEVDINN